MLRVDNGVLIPGVVAPAEGAGDAYMIPVASGKLLCPHRQAWQPLENNVWRFSGLDAVADPHYLGSLDGRHCYVVEVSDAFEPDGYSWDGLRALMGLINPAMFELASRALQVVNWDRDHKFCGRCGGETLQHAQERAKVCSSCGVDYYPRLSPCAITVITRGDECLLAHNAQFPPGMFSALAGFIEAGESVEATLRREVMEEVGLKVGKLEYFNSQSWPFPSQLMLGFHAEYESGDICVDGEEITEANWDRFDQLPFVPLVSTLSGQLIDAFVKRHR